MFLNVSSIDWVLLGRALVMDNVTTPGEAVGTILILDIPPDLVLDPITGKSFVAPSLDFKDVSVSRILTWQLITIVAKTVTKMNNITNFLVFIVLVSIYNPINRISTTHIDARETDRVIHHKKSLHWLNPISFLCTMGA